MRLSRFLKRQPRGLVLECVEGVFPMMKRMRMTGKVRRASGKPQGREQLLVVPTDKESI